MWVLGMLVGLGAFIVGVLVTIVGFLDAAADLFALLPGLVLAAIGSVMVLAFFLWGLVSWSARR